MKKGCRAAAPLLTNCPAVTVTLQYHNMKYFTIPELTRSVTAQKRGINNTPTPEAVKNLTALVDNVLDPLREQWVHHLL